jgi:excisionase family DNA binding protein
MTLDEAAQALKVSRSTVRRMIDEGVLPADHPCPGAPWLVQVKDIERADIQQDARNRRSRRPSSRDPQQNQLDL